MQTMLRSAASQLRQAGGPLAVRLLMQREPRGIPLLNDVESRATDYGRNRVPLCEAATS
jgi:hypothetical protein